MTPGPWGSRSSSVPGRIASDRRRPLWPASKDTVRKPVSDAAGDAPIPLSDPLWRDPRRVPVAFPLLTGSRFLPMPTVAAGALNAISRWAGQ